MTKWFLTILYLYFAAVIISAIIEGDFFWGCLFISMIYFPFYLAAFFPAYLYIINQELNFYVDLLTLSCCLFGFGIAVYLGFIDDWLDPMHTIFAILPFGLLAVKTLHRRSTGF